MRGHVPQHADWYAEETRASLRVWSADLFNCGDINQTTMVTACNEVAAAAVGATSDVHGRFGTPKYGGGGDRDMPLLMPSPVSAA